MQIKVPEKYPTQTTKDAHVSQSVPACVEWCWKDSAVYTESSLTIMICNNDITKATTSMTSHDTTGFNSHHEHNNSQCK